MTEAKRTAKEWKAIIKPGFHADGGGLYLSIVKNSRTWMFRYKRSGKSHWMGLGPDSLVSLATARDAAIDARRLLRQGIDPITAKRTAKSQAAAENASTRTFESVADEYIAAHKAGWKNEKHGNQWHATLEAYAFPIFGQNPVASITVDDVLNCLTPIWEDKPETASRVRGRIENTLDYAKTRGWRTGENPARWKGHLDHLLPARAKIARVVHHAALPWADLPAVMGKLANGGGTSALCLRFAILTAARSGEARGARWNEIDMAGKVWTIPPDRMMARQEHRVPLADATLAILKAVAPLKSGNNGLVFPGGREGKPLSDVAVSNALAAAAEGVTVHGMRSTFRDWAAERTNYPREVAETALAHTNRDRVEAAYRRSDLFEQRIRLMREWAKHCTGPLVKESSASIIQIGPGAVDRSSKKASEQVLNFSIVTR
jgi:integrase